MLQLVGISAKVKLSVKRKREIHAQSAEEILVITKTTNLLPTYRNERNSDIMWSILYSTVGRICAPKNKIACEILLVLLLR